MTAWAAVPASIEQCQAALIEHAAFAQELQQLSEQPDVWVWSKYIHRQDCPLLKLLTHAQRSVLGYLIWETAGFRSWTTRELMSSDFKAHANVSWPTVKKALARLQEIGVAYIQYHDAYGNGGRHGFTVTLLVPEVLEERDKERRPRPKPELTVQTKMDGLMPDWVLEACASATQISGYDLSSTCELLLNLRVKEQLTPIEFKQWADDAALQLKRSTVRKSASGLFRTILEADLKGRGKDRVPKQVEGPSIDSYFRSRYAHVYK